MLVFEIIVGSLGLAAGVSLIRLGLWDNFIVFRNGVVVILLSLAILLKFFSLPVLGTVSLVLAVTFLFVSSVAGFFSSDAVSDAKPQQEQPIDPSRKL